MSMTPPIEAPLIDPTEIFAELDYHLQTGPMAAHLASLKSRNPSRYETRLLNPVETEKLVKARWYELGEYQNLAEHEATRLLQGVEEALTLKVESDEPIELRRYFSLNYDHRAANPSASWEVAWLQERHFRRAVGGLATLYAGATVRLPELEPDAPPTDCTDTHITLVSRDIGHVTIHNLIQRYVLPETQEARQLVPDWLVGMPYGSQYIFRRHPS